MKRFLQSLIIISVLFASCSTDESFSEYQNNAIESVVLSASDFVSFGQTRSALTSDLKFSWTDGDAIGIYPSSGDQISFQVKTSSVGNKTASFDGGGWALKNSETYYAYFPYNAENTLCNNSYNAVLIDYTKQIQVGNNSISHLSAVDYMYAKAEAQNGSVRFDFNHVNSILHLELGSIPAGTEIESVTIKTDGEIFTQTGSLDCSTGEITAQTLSNSQTIQLENTTVGDNSKLDVWMMIAPVDLSQKTLRITAVDENGEEYYICVPGANYKAGYGYLISTNPDPTPYVRFESAESQTLCLTSKGSTTSRVEGDLFYSVGDAAWAKLSPGQTVDFGGNLGDLRLRGKLPYGTARYTDNGISEYYQISFSLYSVQGIACHGDIRTLVDYEDYQNQEGTNVSFWFLFENCYQLTSIPDLPFRKLGEYCYSGLFRGCTRLVEPLDVLDVDEMDYGCCYSMFSKCASLTKAPALPCMNLSEACYQWMFGECTSLTEAPELPAVILKGFCYKEMFTGCTSLKSIKMMGAKIETSNVKSQNCFDNWCKSVPSSGTFYYNSDAEWVTDYSSDVFPSYWTRKAIDTTPYLTFTAESDQFLCIESVGTSSPYNGMSYSLDNGKTWAGIGNKAIRFGGAYGALQLRGNMASGTANDQNNYLRFKFLIDDVPVACAGDIRTIVNYADYHNPDYSNVRFCKLFSDCKQLVSAPKLSIPEKFGSSSATYCYYYMFQNCTSLIEAPDLPVPTYGLSAYCYYGMFSGCSNLQKAPALSANTVPNYGYAWMFYNCTSLETPPDLPASTISTSCYEYMFYNCSSLKQKAKMNNLYRYGDGEDDERYPTNWDKNMYLGCSLIR